MKIFSFFLCKFQIVEYLEKNNIQTRPIFTGNILLHPGFRKIVHRSLKGGYPVTEKVMKNAFLIGCHHGMTVEHLDKIKEVFIEFLNKYI